MVFNSPRRYPRMKSPEGLNVAWLSGTLRFVSRVQTLSLGGLFIRTKQPPQAGTMIQFLIDIPGNGVRARAVVRDVAPGEGMGVGIVAMTQEDRARYFSFLNNCSPESHASNTRHASTSCPAPVVTCCNGPLAVPFPFTGTRQMFMPPLRSDEK